MAYRPFMDGKEATNVYDEHVYKLRVTFAASSVPTTRSKDAVFAKVTTTTFSVTFPQPYAEVTDFSYAWFAASGVAPLTVKVITNALTTTGVLTLETEASNTAGTPTAPAVGDVLYLVIGVSDHASNNDYVA